MRRLCLLLSATAVIAGASAPAWAIPFFQKQFLAEYIADHDDQEFATFVKKEAKCFCCHQGKKSKKNRNAFGAQLSKLLDKKKHKKDKDAVIEALKKVTAMKIDPTMSRRA